MYFLIDHAVYKIKQWILGKGILEYSLSALVSHRRISLCIGKPPYQELKSSHSLHWTYHLVWEYPSLFQAQRTLYFLSLLKACALYSTWPTPRLYLSSEGRVWVFPLQHKRGACKQITLESATRRDLLAVRDQQTLLKMIFFLVFFRAAPAAHGGSQARGRIGAAAADLHHSHSNTRSGPHLQSTPHL